jgi:hypothetical protein
MMYIYIYYYYIIYIHCTLCLSPSGLVASGFWSRVKRGLPGLPVPGSWRRLRLWFEAWNAQKSANSLVLGFFFFLFWKKKWKELWTLIGWTQSDRLIASTSWFKQSSIDWFNRSVRHLTDLLSSSFIDFNGHQGCWRRDTITGLALLEFGLIWKALGRLLP